MSGLRDMLDSDDFPLYAWAIVVYFLVIFGGIYFSIVRGDIASLVLSILILVSSLLFIKTVFCAEKAENNEGNNKKDKN